MVSNIQDELPVYEYFVPLTSKSDLASVDFDDVEDYGNTGFNRYCCQPYDEKRANKHKKCIPRKFNIFKEEQLAREFRKPRTIAKKELGDLPISNAITLPSGTVPTDCCHHSKEQTGRRKYFVSFGTNNASINASGDDCGSTDKDRCEAFWAFIDSQPNLLDLVQEGEFEHMNAPHLLVLPSKQKDTSVRCKNAELLRARDEALHAEDRERMLRRKMKTEELEEKSGQGPLIRKYNLKSGRNKAISEKKPSQLYADSVPEPFADIMKQMKIFDEACGNPVSISSVPRLVGDDQEEETEE